MNAYGSTDAVIRFEQTAANSGAGEAWDVGVDATTGRLTFNSTSNGPNHKPLKIDDGAVNNLMRIGITATDTVDINGNLAVDGDITATGAITPDYVFTPEYSIPSISEHALFMWSNQHLPAVAPARTTPDGKGLINLGERSQGVLEELELAHIYIEKLHNRLARLEKAISDLQELSE